MGIGAVGAAALVICCPHTRCRLPIGVGPTTPVSTYWCERGRGGGGISSTHRCLAASTAGIIGRGPGLVSQWLTIIFGGPDDPPRARSGRSRRPEKTRARFKVFTNGKEPLKSCPGAGSVGI